ncbi:hypothetical protein KAURM247S_08250 [Kitasatospora aureofaciens]
MLGRREREHLRTQWRFGREVESARCGIRQEFRQGRLVGRSDRQSWARLSDGQHPLVRRPVDRWEDRPQGFVPVDEVAQRRLQGSQVQRSREPPRERHVVDGFGTLQLAQEPQPPLSGRQRHQRGPLRRLQGEPGPVRATQPGGQAGHRRVAEQGVQRQLHAQHRPCPGDQPGGQQGVPTEVEEVVVGADLGEAQHLGEQPGQHVLLRGVRFPARRRSGGGRLGQGASVQLAAGVERKGVEGDVRGRHHVVGQPLAQVRPQVLRPKLRPGDGHHVGDQTRVLRPVLPDDHGGPYDLRVLRQCRLDLTEFDPESPELDLVVGAAEEFQVPVRVPAHQVSGAVHPRTPRPEQVSDEPSRRQPRPVQVSARQADAGDVQLARHTGGHRLQGGVEHVQSDAPERSADHLVRARLHRCEDRVHRALGRPVVVQGDHSVGRPQALPQLLGNALPAHRDQQRTPLRMVQQSVRHEDLHVRRSGTDGIKSDPRGVVEVSVRVGPSRLVQNVQLVARVEARHLVAGGVERHGRGQPHPQPVLRLLGVHQESLVGEEVQQTAVRGQHALGPPGGP